MQASSAASEHCKQSGSKKWNHHQISGSSARYFCKPVLHSFLASCRRHLHLEWPGLQGTSANKLETYTPSLGSLAGSRQKVPQNNSCHQLVPSEMASHQLLYPDWGWPANSHYSWSHITPLAEQTDRYHKKTGYCARYFCKAVLHSFMASCRRHSHLEWPGLQGTSANKLETYTPSLGTLAGSSQKVPQNNSRHQLVPSEMASHQLLYPD